MMHVLILEDDVLIAIDLSEMVADLGHRPVGPFHTVTAAVAAIRSGTRIDYALLDHSIGPTSSADAQAALLAEGIPFAYVTGHGREDLKGARAGAPILVKPVIQSDLARLFAGELTASVA